MNHLYFGHFLVSALQYSVQVHPNGKVPILGKILCTEQRRRNKQDSKTKNRTAQHFHFYIPQNSMSLKSQPYCTVAKTNRTRGYPIPALSGMLPIADMQRCP